MRKTGCLSLVHREPAALTCAAWNPLEQKWDQQNSDPWHRRVKEGESEKCLKCVSAGVWECLWSDFHWEDPRIWLESFHTCGRGGAWTSHADVTISGTIRCLSRCWDTNMKDTLNLLGFDQTDSEWSSAALTHDSNMKREAPQTREGGGVGWGHQWKVRKFANLPNLSLLHGGGEHWDGEKKKRNQNQSHPDKLLDQHPHISTHSGLHTAHTRTCTLHVHTHLKVYRLCCVCWSCRFHLTRQTLSCLKDDS